MNHWTDNPAFPVVDWQAEVANGDTRLGYAEWVENQRALNTPARQVRTFKGRGY